MSKQDVAIGVAAGVAIAALAPLALLLAVGAGRRPVMRALARGGQALAEKAHETFAEFQEIAEDFVAELRAPNDAIAAGAGAAGSSPKSPEAAQSSAPADTPGA